MTDSTMITAPSIIKPKSSAPKLIKFPLTPNRFIIQIANNIDNGITDATSKPARRFPKNKIKTKLQIKYTEKNKEYYIDNNRVTKASEYLSNMNVIIFSVRLFKTIDKVEFSIFLLIS